MIGLLRGAWLAALLGRELAASQEQLRRSRAACDRLAVRASEARGVAADAADEARNERTNALSWYRGFMALGSELDAVTAERDRACGEVTYWLEAWGGLGEDYIRDMRRAAAVRIELQAALDAASSAAVRELTDLRGRVAVLTDAVRLRDATVARLEADIAEARRMEREAWDLAARNTSQAVWADRWKALARRLRGEAETVGNLCRMAEQERDAAREQGAAEAFALRVTLAETRAEAERISADLRRERDHADTTAVAAPVGCPRGIPGCPCLGPGPWSPSLAADRAKVAP